MLRNNAVNYKINYLIKEAVIQNQVNSFITLLENAEYQELQESISFKDINNKYKKTIESIVRLFNDPNKVSKIKKEEKEAQKKRKDYLKKYNINVNKFTRALKNGDDISIPLKLLLEELFDKTLDFAEKGKGKSFLKKFFLLTLLATIMFVVFDTLTVGLPSWMLLIYSIIFVPLFDEIFKRVSVKHDLGGITFIGQSLPTGMAAVGAVSIDLGLYGAAGAGLVALLQILFQLITWLIHVKGNLLDKYKEDFKVESDKKSSYKNIATFQATIVSILNQELSIFAKDALGSILDVATTTAGTFTVLEKEKAKKEFGDAIDKFLKPLKGIKVPKKI